MRFVKANGLVIHYRDQGQRDRPPLVFINSLGTDFRIWNDVAEIHHSAFGFGNDLLRHHHDVAIAQCQGGAR